MTSLILKKLALYCSALFVIIFYDIFWPMLKEEIRFWRTMKLCKIIDAAFSEDEVDNNFLLKLKKVAFFMDYDNITELYDIFKLRKKHVLDQIFDNIQFKYRPITYFFNFDYILGLFMAFGLPILCAVFAILKQEIFRRQNFKQKTQ